MVGKPATHPYIKNTLDFFWTENLSDFLVLANVRKFRILKRRDVEPEIKLPRMSSEQLRAYGVKIILDYSWGNRVYVSKLTAVHVKGNTLKHSLIEESMLKMREKELEDKQKLMHILNMWSKWTHDL